MTKANATDNLRRLLDGLRGVGNLHEFAELFGFDWNDDSDWHWHDVAVKMADDIEAAIEAWNTRAERTCRWTGSVGLGLADGAYDEESDTYHAVPVVCHHFDCGHGTITEGYEIPAFCPVCGAKVIGG